MAKSLAFIVGILLLGYVSQDQEEGSWRTSDKLDVAAPFRDSASKNLLVETSIDRDGKMTVAVTLKDVNLNPGASTSLPPDVVRGDWVARFIVTPKYSAEDYKSVSDLLEKRRPRGKGDLSSDSFAANPYLFPDVYSKDHAYSIESCSRVPIDHQDEKIVQEFVRKLSKHLTAYGSKESEELLTWRLLR